MDLIERALREGLMVAGDLRGGEFVRWPLSVDGSLHRIQSSWTRDWPDQIPTPGSVVWLDLTQDGKRMAQATLEREAGVP